MYENLTDKYKEGMYAIMKISIFNPISILRILFALTTFKLLKLHKKLNNK